VGDKACEVENMEMKSRIAPIDGLRACAVLGVMWAHTWMFFGNISFKAGPVDINRIISFGGIGVDLFFVISGFCMYLMYQKKVSHFSAKHYGGFLLKRWKRIAPAFYFIVVFQCLFYFWTYRHFPFESFFGHLFFANTFISNNVLSPPFWSLSTEWQFYLLLPFLFARDPEGGKRLARIVLLFAICFCLRLALFYQHASDMHNGVTILSDKIWYRFIEFGWGMIAARIYIAHKPLPGILLGYWGFILSFCVAYIGRLLMVTEVYNHFYSFAFVIKALAEPLLTFGFALMLLNVIESKSVFSSVLSLPAMQFLGRISYSMYLWHWIILWNICNWWKGLAPISNLNLNLAYLMTLTVVIPVSWISYKLFEAPYFKTGKKQSPGALYKKLA
jgi:peptidoglycan/LPS O-acetylase OafA/YrhL